MLDALGLRKFLEWVKNSQTRPEKVSFIARNNRQSMTARRRGRIKQPAHGFIFLGNSPLRVGISSIGTGHFFQTDSQFDFRFSRRSVTVSSSASKVASN
jgi:hypothetical protein